MKNTDGKIHLCQRQELILVKEVWYSELEKKCVLSILPLIKKIETWEPLVKNKKNCIKAYPVNTKELFAFEYCSP